MLLREKQETRKEGPHHRNRKAEVEALRQNPTIEEVSLSPNQNYRNGSDLKKSFWTIQMKV